MIPILKDTEQQNRQIINILQKLDRTILENKKLIVKNVNDYVGYTERDKSISINLEDIRNKTKNELHFLGVVKGVNIHEVGHNEITDYTPTDFNKLIPILKDDFDLFRDILGILEDSRLENHLTLKYPITKKYLKICFNVIILPNITDLEQEKLSKKDILKIIIRLIGTDYLNDTEYKAVINETNNLFKNNFDTAQQNEIKALIKEYVNLKTTKNKRLNIGLKLLDYVKEDNEDGETDGDNPNPTNPNPTNPNPNGQPKDNDEDEDNENEDEDEDNEDGETQPNPTDTPTNPNPKPKEHKNKDKKIIQKIKELIDEIEEQTENELKNDTELEQELKTINTFKYTETDEVTQAVREITAELSRIKEQKPLIRLREQKRGKLNIKDFVKKFGDKF